MPGLDDAEGPGSEGWQQPKLFSPRVTGEIEPFPHFFGQVLMAIMEGGEIGQCRPNVEPSGFEVRQLCFQTWNQHLIAGRGDLGEVI